MASGSGGWVPLVVLRGQDGECWGVPASHLLTGRHELGCYVMGQLGVCVSMCGERCMRWTLLAGATS